MKTAIIILSDPKSGSEESLGRLFNALALAHESRAAGDIVEIVFKGTGARWPAELAKLAHPAHEIYQSVRESVHGVSLACSAVFGAQESAKACGLPLLSDAPLPGTPGLAAMRRYFADGWNVVTF